MQKISVSKELFEDILLKKILVLSKENNKYWKKILLEPKIVNDNIEYSIKQFDNLTITNGLGKDSPLLVIECKKIDYSSSKDCFEFSLGKIIEQKNTNLEENYKDNLIEELLREKELLKDQMNRDHLTKVYNRRKMEDDLKVFSRQSNSSFLSAIFIDADRFKGINDNFGHEAGDKALIYLANKLKKHAEVLNGEVYRYGGEEFIILCFITKNHILEKLNELKEDIKSKKLYHPLRDISITVSIGVSFLSDCNNVDEMIQKADKGVYKAKDNGRDRIEFV
ncbi:GGDEF domain-containing protein [Arcobacter peruensis]|uniref:GGDEF domain-containing protein n=1 Tax=Arcobacter peruensis TaxID=2320140 RepID=UPI000F0976B5|nr:GGDEF domain-containing protein [Arcobacter peruensis]